jgi:multidrug resistance protein MdtO
MSGAASDLRIGNDYLDRGLAERVASIRAYLLSGRVPPPVGLPGKGEASHVVPLLREMEETVSLIREVFTGSQRSSAYPTLLSYDDPPSTLFVPDALSNSDHIKFGLKGSLAASLCYIIYTSLAWPEISTAVVTCILTALSTVGASRQKQVLRVTGAIVGGVIVGIGAQMFILPYLDSISGFTLLFIAVTVVASWFATSSPRLSYFGVQLALAFYIINLQEFKVQTSLTVARDRVLGILLGLTMMWLVFDQLWSAPAAVEMKKAFISSLRLQAQLASEPSSKDLRVSLERIYSLRETINTSLENVRAFTDAVLFEFGPSRQQDVALRRQIVRWQTQLRMLFLMQIAWLKYSLQLPGFELPEAIRVSQQEFDDRLVEMLDGMADRIEGKAPKEKENFKDSFERLERKIRACCSEEPQEELASKLQTFLTLFCRIENFTLSLDEEI